MGTNPAMGSAPVPPAAPIAQQPPAPMPAAGSDGASNIEDLKLRAMLQKRLEQFLGELEGIKIPKPKAISLLGTIIGQMQQSFGLSQSHVRQAMKLPQNQGQDQGQHLVQAV